MIDIKVKFSHYYFEVLRKDPLFTAMENTVEDSPWHRERNVAVHTDMVVTNYLMMSSSHFSSSTSPIKWLVGALACAFHDVGKPSSEEICNSADRGTYRRYGGHEQVSARLWEDWAVTNFNSLTQWFPQFTTRDIYLVGWIIEHHLPYGIKDPQKLLKITATTSHNGIMSVFGNCLKADCLGRMSDDHEEKVNKTFSWVFDTLDECDWEPTDSDKVCTLLIGPSRSGKSTFTSKTLFDGYHSMDLLRREWYDAEDYTKAFNMSCDDKTFKNRVQQHFLGLVKADCKHVIVDNTNLTSKARNFYVSEARRRGYEVRAVLFPNSRANLLARRHYDKTIGDDVVMRHYDMMSLPSYGEFDYIQVVNTFSS